MAYTEGHAVSGVVACNYINYVSDSNLYVNSAGISNYIYQPPKPKTFAERLEDEIKKWHGNILNDIKQYG